MNKVIFKHRNEHLTIIFFEAEKTKPNQGKEL